MGKKTFAGLIYAGTVAGVAIIFASNFVAWFTSNITVAGIGSGLGVLAIVGTVVYAMSVAHNAVLD